MRAAVGRQPTEGTNLVTSARKEGAWLGSVAQAFDVGTDALAPLSRPGQPLPGIRAGNQGWLFAFPGGVPLEAGVTVAGVIEASDAVNQDQQVAETGAPPFQGKVPMTNDTTRSGPQETL